LTHSVDLLRDFGAAQHVSTETKIPDDARALNFYWSNMRVDERHAHTIQRAIAYPTKPTLPDLIASSRERNIAMASDQTTSTTNWPQGFHRGHAISFQRPICLLDYTARKDRKERFAV
jgi:hypothetical protein